MAAHDYESLRPLLLHCGTFLTEGIALRELAWLAHEAGHKLDALAAYLAVGIDRRTSVALAPREYFIRLEAGSARPSPRDQWLRANGVPHRLRVATFRRPTFRCSALELGYVLDGERRRRGAERWLLRGPMP